MNKKFYLAALGATLAFAACTEEELVSVPTQVSLENREKIELEITANKSDIVSTRITSEAGEEAGVFTFKWEKDIDKLGAAMADGKALGTVNTDNNVYISYPFTANTSDVSSSFSGKSSIAQGLYFFHYPYHDHLGRTALDVSVPAQAYDATSETAAIDQAMKYMKMITPIVKLNQNGVNGVTYEAAQSYKLPLTFEKLYTIVRVDITAKNIEEGNAPAVEKVVLRAGVNADEPTPNFIKTAKLNLSELTIADNKKINGTNPVEYEFDEANFVARRKELHDAIYEGRIYTSDATEGDIELSVKGVTLSNEGTQSLYVLVPKGNWENVELAIMTSEGKYTKNIAALNIGETGTVDPGVDVSTSDAEKANAELYGKRDNIQPITAALDFNLDGTGNVILPEIFDVSSETEWDNNVTFLKNHAIAYINKQITFMLKKDITIKNLPVFKLVIDTDRDDDGNNITRKLTLKSDYTINAENVEQFNAPYVTLAMTSNKTLTLDATMTGFKAIENSGTLVVKAYQDKPITNNRNANMTIDASVEVGNITNAGTINISKDKVLTAKITNNKYGTVNLVAGSTKWNVSNGTMNNDGGTININAGTTVAGQAITNYSTINHAGILTANISNTGSKAKTINIKKGAVGNGSATINGGKIVVEDIADYAKVMGEPTKKYVISGSTVTAVVNNYTEYALANNDDSGLTNITLAAGNWAYVLTSVAEADKDKKLFTAPNKDKISGIEYKGGTLKLNDKAALEAAINFTGTTTVVCPADIEGVILASKIIGNITNSEALTISEGVTVNSKDGFGTTNANLNGNVTVKSGAAMFFNTATVEKGKELIIEGDIRKSNSNNKLVTNPAVFGVNGAFKNKGYIESKAGTGKDATPGQVSQPRNEASGTFKGNATAWEDLFDPDAE